MLAKKTAGFLLAALLLLGCAGAAIMWQRQSAAAAGPVTLTKENASLFLPDTYEQYLGLQSPAYLAIDTRYTAVADGKNIYVYDRENADVGYRLYEHQHGVESVTVGRMQFSESGNLYFTSSAGFFKLTLGEIAETQVASFTPYTFLLDGSTLYAVTTSEGVNTTLYRFDNFEASGKSLELNNASCSVVIQENSTAEQRISPIIAYDGGMLYCAIGDTVRRYRTDDLSYEGLFTLDKNAASVLSPVSVCATAGALWYTTKNGLYRSDLNGSSETILEDKAATFGALSFCNGYLYLLKDKSVHAYDIAAEQFTDYEIAAASSSRNRLSGATDVARAGSLVVIADTANSRVTVYNGDTGTYSVLAPEGEEFSPTLVATDGKTIAAASDSTVYVCKDAKKSMTFETPVIGSNGKIKGIACMYGKVYYVTQNNFYGVLDGTNVTKSVSGTPTFMASDLYGNLYVAYSDQSVISFTEEQFLAGGSTGTKLGATVPTEAKAMRAGFDGTLYYLDESGHLHSTESEIAAMDGKNFVYTGEENKYPASFALGYEDDEVYFLFGDFIVKSNTGALGLSLFGQLSDAKDIVRAGNLLVTADTGNNRVTVYDMKKHSYTVIETDFSPTLVATDGSVIAAANGNKVYVCKDPSGYPYFGEPTTADLGTIKGLACVHGSVYYITEYGYGKVEEEDKGLVSRLESSLIALTVDDKGILYVVDLDGHVRYYYEDEFADFNVPSGGDAGKHLHTPISSLRADHEGNLYYISENALWKNDEKLTDFGNNSFGYGGESCPVAFALDFESDDVYLLYGNYTVKTKQGDLGISPKNYSGILVNRQDILSPDSRRKRS